MKLTIYALLFLSTLLFLTLEAADTCHPPSKEWADELFFATCFDESVEVYKNVLEKNTCSEQEIPTVYYRIGQSYYMLKQYQNAANILETYFFSGKENITEPTEDNLESFIQALDLAGKCYRKINNFDKAHEMYDKALLLTHNLPAQEKFDLLFEKGLTYFESKNYDSAQKLISEVWQNTSNHESHHLTGLFLARTMIAQRCYVEAEKILLSLNLAKPATQHLPLSAEINFILGEINYFKENYTQASHYFENSLPEKNITKALWTKEAHLYLGSCYLKLAAEQALDLQTVSQMLDSTEHALKKSLEISFDEESYSRLMQCYLLRKKKLNDPSSYELAKRTFDCFYPLLTDDQIIESTLILAESAPTHQERDLLFSKFIRETDRRSPLFSIGWYQKGINNLNEAQYILRVGEILRFEPRGFDALKTQNFTDPQNNEQINKQKAILLLENAASELQNAFELLKNKDKNLAALSIRYSSEALYLQGIPSKKEKAFNQLFELVTEYRDLLNALEEPEEIYYLLGVIGGNLIFEDEASDYMEKTTTLLNTLITTFPQGKRVSDAYLLIGKIHYKRKDYLEAEANFATITEKYSESHLMAESLFWLGKTKSKLNVDKTIVNEIYTRVFTSFENSPFAAEAYFSIFTFQDYLQGRRNASKHLQGFVKKFPNSPLTTTCHYLLGMDYKKDRKSSSGRWIRKKNLAASIESFQAAVDVFDRCYDKGLILDNDLKYYTSIRYRSILEKGLVNLTVANESQGAKKLIYLEYAEKIFKQLVEEFEISNVRPLKLLTKGNSYDQIQEEASYSLAITYIKMSKFSEAEKNLFKMIEKYHAEKITKGYYLSRAWYQLGLIAMNNKEYLLALDHFGNAEDTSKGNILSANERLDLQIQESTCHKFLNRLDFAMLILSKVINDHAVSSLRVKAMYLRAELYEEQGRDELARKQLEATAKKGGPWALKAKTKLEENYGYL